MAQTDCLQSEQEHHKKAFEIYWSLGAKRSYRQTASEVGVSRSTICLWARSFDWQDQIKLRETQSAKDIAARTTASQINHAERIRKLIRMALGRVARAIAEDRVSASLITSLDRLIRLDMLVSGDDEYTRTIPGEIRSVEDIKAYLETLKSSDLDIMIESLEGNPMNPGELA